MTSSSVPSGQCHAPEDMELVIEGLRAKVEAVGEGMLVYLLLLAEMEAKGISDCARCDAENAEAASTDQ